MAASTRSIREATKALQVHFSGPKIPLSLPTEPRRMLQAFVDDYDGIVEDDDAARVSQELKSFWERYVNGSTQKLGAFMGVLRELRPAITDEDDMLQWYHLVAKLVVNTVSSKKSALEDAQEYLVSVMVYDEEDSSARARSRVSARICNDLLGIYVARTHRLASDDGFIAPENSQIAKQVETVLINYGKKMPKLFFLHIDDLVVRDTTRLQGLTLLSSYLQHQTPHLYLVIRTALLDDLLKCLMNDTSTTVLSAALTSLIMLMPHIPSSLASHLGRLFLIYSRLLCWEKFSPLSTEAQRNLVTDDRISTDDRDHGDVGIDPNWEKVRPREGAIEPATPELMTYFTYLYGLYPLNFMSYIRKPRRYLKNLDFAGADEFDLDQTVIRSRSDQLRQAHLLHPNFYNMTIDEELSDPKWPKMDPADVVAECHGLAVHGKSSLVSPGPPPTGKLPDIPPVPPIPGSVQGSLSPAISHTSLRSGHSWRDTQSTAVSATSADPESPVLGPTPSEEKVDELQRPRTAPNQGSARPSPMLDEFPLPSAGFPGLSPLKEKRGPINNLEYLQQKLCALQNDLSFERWHKAQYSSHISQLMRKNVKDATAEAETLNLINANKALKQQLEQVRHAREATIKDSNLTRKQSNNVETHMTERFNKMKKEQETWAADGEELRRLRSEMKNYRELLSAAESRELNKTHQLEMMKRDMDQLQKLQAQLQEMQRKVRECEFREFDYENAKREMEIVQSEKDTLLMRVQRQDQDRERTKRMYSERIAELEAQIGGGGTSPGSPIYERSMSSLNNIDNHALQQALTDAQSKLSQLKKAHSRLLEKYTDLELEYASAKNQLDAMHVYSDTGYVTASRSNSLADASSNVMSGGLGSRGGILESVYGVESEYGAAPSETAYTNMSASDPTPQRHLRGPGAVVSPGGTSGGASIQPRSEVSMDSRVGLTWKPSHQPTKSRQSRDSVDPYHGYNPTKPLTAEERSLTSSGESAGTKEQKAKIAAKSEVRVYGRGGAQNIGKKTKDTPTGSGAGSAKAEQPPQKKGGFKTFKVIAGL